MSFVVKIPLYAPQQNKFVSSRFNIAGELYNSFLTECLNRSQAKITSQTYKQAIEIYKKNNFKSNDESGVLFNQATIESGFYLRSSSHGMNNSLEQFAAKVTKGRDFLDIGSHTRNQLMERAFQTVKRSNKQRSKVHYKGWKNPITCLSGKDKDSNIRWIPSDNFNNSYLLYRIGIGKKKSREVKLYPIKNCFKENDVFFDIIKTQPKFSKLIRKKVKGKWTYEAQLTYDGVSPTNAKHKKGKGEMGFDYGPSAVAIVADGFAKKTKLFVARDYYKEIRVLQRKQARQQFDNNPSNYEPNGTIKKGKKTWKKSKRQIQTEVKLAEIQRKQAEHRKCMQGKLANEMRTIADVSKVEDLSKVSWQKNYGKSVGRNAPGGKCTKF